MLVLKLLRLSTRYLLANNPPKFYFPTANNPVGPDTASEPVFSSPLYKLSRTFTPRVKEYLKNEMSLLPLAFSSKFLKQFIDASQGISKDKNPKNASAHSSPLKRDKQSPKNTNQSQQKVSYKLEHPNIEEINLKLAALTNNNWQSIGLIKNYLAFLQKSKPEIYTVCKQLKELADLTSPQDWYPEARKIKRKIIYHHGPTNSGKTSTALQQIKKSSKGIYMAPLRLLAWQTQQKLLPCSLVTGQQKVIMDSGLVSCTIETADLTTEYDVAIIDEVQMMGDPERGWAWTQAFFGVRAKVIHLCGDERAIGLISKLVCMTGDTLEERRYSRLSKLKLIHNPISMIKDLKPGDCLIAFQIRKLLKIRALINSEYGDGENKNQVAIVYGRLPPDVRKKQAELFNSGALPYLVATNAIGMGLNLKINRIIFYELEKMNSHKVKKRVEDHEIQQIAGRAGRGLTNGYVQTRQKSDLKIVRNALLHVNKTYGLNLVEEGLKPGDNPPEGVESSSQVDLRKRKSAVVKKIVDPHLNRILSDHQCSISKAGLYPSFDRLDKFHKAQAQITGSQLPLAKLLDIFRSVAKVSDEFSIQRMDSICQIANIIDNMDLKLADLYVFSLTPMSTTDQQSRDFLKKMAEGLKNGRVALPTYFHEDSEDSYMRFRDEKDLKHLETCYMLLEMYVWLGLKYQHIFIQVPEAVHCKKLICERMNHILSGEHA